MKTETVRRTVNVAGLGRVTCLVRSKVLANGWRVDQVIKDARYAETGRLVDRKGLPAVRRAVGAI
jgi:hypothetical protein